MTNILNKFNMIKYKSEKQRLLYFGMCLIVILMLASYLFTVAYSRYEVRTKILANIDKALYIFGTDDIGFNLEPNGIVPSDNPYVYKFSVSNFNDKHVSDVDLKYSIKVKTTTNLPISIGLYRNEVYDSSGATNILPVPNIVQDEDGAWYRYYNMDDSYEMNYKDRVTDVYTMVIYFPEKYKENSTYADYLESIEVSLESNQII